MSEYDKEEYDFLLEFILHEECLLLKHIDKRIDKTHLLVTSENNIEFLTNTPHPLHLEIISPIWLSDPTHALTDFSHLLQNQIIPLSK